MLGVHGRYLRIDLTAGASEFVPIPPAVSRAYLGGVGLAAWLLPRESPASVSPLSADAAVVFAFSPLVGTPLTTSAKFAVVAKSPLTNRFNDALSSSHFAIHGKRTGADAIVLRGACAVPSVVLIDDGRVSVEPLPVPADEPIPVTAERLKSHYGPGWSFGVVGPAGRNRVRYATVSFDNRHAGRGGLGAVLGAKNVLAIGVKGTQRPAVADPTAVVAAARDLSKRSFCPATAKYRELGTVTNLLTFNRLNALPTRNFQQGQFEAADGLSVESLRGALPQVRNSCAACTIGCEHIFPAADGTGVRLEYESLFALGPLCGIGDRDTVLKAAQMCDELGLDTISTGATIAFAMECSERGLIPDRLPFGDGDTLLSLIERIARRDGLGDLLADGSRRAAEVIGGGSEDFAPHVKGMELPGYEPRALQAMALGFAVGSRGADHNRSGAYEIDFSVTGDRLHGTADAARQAVDTEDRAALMDSLILCKFLRGVFTDFFAESAELLIKVTGEDFTADELKAVARRVVDSRKRFNIREGWTPAEDTLPRRFLSTALPDGTAPGATLPEARLREMIAAYNRARGWSADGWPHASEPDA